MKKSSQVPASLIVAFAAGLSVAGTEGCSSRRCEDAYGNVLPDSACNYYQPGARWIQYGGFGGSGGGYGGYGGGGYGG